MLRHKQLTLLKFKQLMHNSKRNYKRKGFLLTKIRVLE
jgi:hypothetical protein